jgi:hypothetical protein
MTLRASSDTTALVAMQGQVTTLQGLATSMQSQITTLANEQGGFTYVVATPAAGSTYNAVAGFNLIESGGLLATMTISLPVGSFDGQFLNIFFLNGITLLAWTGAAHNSVPTGIGANNSIQFLWDASTSSWHRCG